MNKPVLEIVVSLIVVALVPLRTMGQVTWSQPPLELDPNIATAPLLCGWNESARSTQYEGARRNWRMDADDFRCSGPMPVTAIRWWGGYKGWQSAEPPLSPQPAAWHIGFWANLVEGLEPNDLYPERLVWSVEVPNERVEYQAVGLDCIEDRFPEMCFAYDVNLTSEEWFHPAEFASNDGVFWISITAIYPTDAEAINMWGWHTRPPLWGRGAMMPAIMGEWPDPEERLFPGRIYPIENALQCGDTQACDMCFELLTAESRVHHDEPFTGLRDWPGVNGHRSLGVRLEQEGLIVMDQVADDWTCETSDPVAAVAWHGCYQGYHYGACGCDATAAPRHPDSFLFMIWLDGIPYRGLSGFPGRPIWECEVFEYDEVLVGYAANGGTGPNKPVYRYIATLPDDARFRPYPVDGPYWFSVVAAYDGPIGDLPHIWQWADHPHVFGAGALTMEALDVMSYRTELTDPNGAPVDMSFTLYTAPDANAAPEPNAVPVQWPTQPGG